jgi:hypothetical protein
MKRLIAVAVLTAGCGPMFDSPMAPEPVAWNVKGGGPVCWKVKADFSGFESPTLSTAPNPTPPCPPGWQVPVFRD